MAVAVGRAKLNQVELGIWVGGTREAPELSRGHLARGAALFLTSARDKADQPKVFEAVGRHWNTGSWHPGSAPLELSLCVDLGF